jgi:GT2 family glycosyltransferase
MIDVSIIIVNYNTYLTTKTCIDSVFQHTSFKINFEVILVDNNSEDESTTHFMNDSRITLVKSSINLGFGMGNNLGRTHATGKYLFLLNSDTILLNDAVSYFFYFMEKNMISQKIGVIGTILLDINQNEGLSYSSFKSISSLTKQAGNKLLKKVLNINVERAHPVFDSFHVDAVIGANMFMPSNIYDLVQGFDPAIFMYGEEVDMQKSVAKHGFSRVIVRGPKIIHLEGASSDNKLKRLSFSTIYNLQKGSLYYIKKHHSRFYYYCYKIVNVFTWVPWITLDIRFNLKQKSALMLLLLK